MCCGIVSVTVSLAQSQPKLRESLIARRLDTVALLHTFFPCLQTCQTHVTSLPTHSRWLKVCQKTELHLTLCLSLSLSVSLCLSLSLSVSLCLSVCLSVSPSVCLYLFVQVCRLCVCTCVRPCVGACEVYADVDEDVGVDE